MQFNRIKIGGILKVLNPDAIDYLCSALDIAAIKLEGVHIYSENYCYIVSRLYKKDSKKPTPPDRILTAEEILELLTSKAVVYASKEESKTYENRDVSS